MDEKLGMDAYPRKIVILQLLLRISWKTKIIKGLELIFSEENESKRVKEAKHFSTAATKKQNDTGEKEEVFSKKKALLLLG